MNWNPREHRSGSESSPVMGIASYTVREISPQEDPGGYGEYRSAPMNRPTVSYPERSTPAPAPPPADSFAQARQEPLLTSAIIVSVLIMLYEVIVVVVKPSWLVVATDWVRASLSWVELLPVLLAAILLYRHRKPGAVAWMMFAAAMLSYAIAQTAWAILDQIIVPGNVPVPSLADLFYLLQYPFFFLGLALLPGIVNQGRPGIARAKVVLDSVLLMAAGTALSWYFLLAPFYLQSGQSVLGKATNMAYPVGDLGLLFGLTVVLISQNRQVAGQAALRLFIPAVLFLIIADSIFLNEELYTSFVPGDAANVAWMACYILFALAGLVRYRDVQREDRIGRTNAAQVGEQPLPSNSAIKGVRGLQSLIPFLAAVIASTLIVFRAATAPFMAGGGRNLIIPFLVGLGLLALVGARQGITVLENERLLRNEKRRAEELDQAKQVAEQQRRLLAERNERLQVDIQMLKDIHAQVAGGDYSARVPITSGELLPIAGSLNIMLDRLSNLIRASSNYTRLEQAIRMMEMAAHGIADGDDRALQGLSIQTNTALDGVSIALRKIRVRMQELGMGLQNLEHIRKTAHELNEMTAHQSQSLAEESAALNKVSETLAQFVTDLEHIIPLQARSLNMSPMSNRQTSDWVQFLRQLVEIIREQQKQINTQVARLHRLKEQANLSASGSRRLVTELSTMAQADINRMLPSGTQYETGRLTRKSVSFSAD